MNARNLVFGTLAAAILAAASFLAGMTISDRDVAMAETVSAATPVSPDALAGMVGRDGTVTDAQRAAVEAIIKDYLMKNPEVVRDAINELQQATQAMANMAGGAATGGAAPPPQAAPKADATKIRLSRIRNAPKPTSRGRLPAISYRFPR